MSPVLERALDPERKSDADANDARHAFGHGPSGAGYAAHGGYLWPQVLPRNADTPRRRRADPPRHSRFGDLTP